MPSRRCLLAVLAGACALPPSADAAVTCSFDAAGHEVDVTLTADGDAASLRRTPAGAIELVSGGCGAATVTNTDRIVMTDASGGDTQMVIDTRDGGLGPGFTNEFFGSEIEIEVEGNAGSEDTLTIVGTDADQRWDAGSAMGGYDVNLHAQAIGNDVDVEVDGVEEPRFDMRGGDDDVALVGGPALGGPMTVGARMLGGPGSDLLIGGSGPDMIDGEEGDDFLEGGGANDVLTPGPGDDNVDGGTGAGDAVGYFEAPAGVSVDLAATGAQQTGGSGADTIDEVEWLYGSGFADTLAGTDASNIISGVGGDDLVLGRGNDDELYGGDGTDTLSFADSAAGVVVSLVTGVVTGGAGADFADEFEDLVGGPGNDVLEGSVVANRIDGGAGADVLRGLAGPDVLLARDGASDDVSCGEDNDHATTDAADVDRVAGDCEDIDRQAVVAGASPVAGPTAAPVAAPVAAPATRSVAAPARPLRLTVRVAPRQKAKTRRLALDVACADRACNAVVGGRIQLRGKGRAAPTLRLPTTRRTIAAGRGTRIVLKLSRADAARIRRAIARGGRATARLAVTASGEGSPSATASATIALTR